MSRPTVLVTGASAGIGRATAVAFAGRGFDVAGGSRDAGRLAGVAAQVRAAGGDFIPVVGNVRDPRTARDAVQAVEARWGRLDVLVNNAGGGFPSPARELSDGGWRAILGATLDGPWWFSRDAYPLLEAAGGVVVNVASIAGLRPSPRMAAYAVAKAGLIALTRALGAEWAPHVRVVALALGTIATPGVADVLGPDGLAATAARIPMGRLGEPAEVAELICHLASPAAAFITGTTIVVDGGQSTASRLGP